MVVQGASLAEVQGKAASQTPPPTEARGKCPAAPAPGVDAPAPRAGDDAFSPGDWTDLTPFDTGDAPLVEKAKRGSQTYVQCTWYEPSTKDIVSTRVRVELRDQKVNRKKSETKLFKIS
jgi:hypothetical protein